MGGTPACSGSVGGEVAGGGPDLGETTLTHKEPHAAL